MKRTAIISAVSSLLLAGGILAAPAMANDAATEPLACELVAHRPTWSDAQQRAWSDAGRYQCTARVSVRAEHWRHRPVVSNQLLDHNVEQIITGTVRAGIRCQEAPARPYNGFTIAKTNSATSSSPTTHNLCDY